MSILTTDKNGTNMVYKSNHPPTQTSTPLFCVDGPDYFLHLDRMEPLIANILCRNSAYKLNMRAIYGVGQYGEKKYKKLFVILIIVISILIFMQNAARL